MSFRPIHHLSLESVFAVWKTKSSSAGLVTETREKSTLAHVASAACQPERRVQNRYVCAAKSTASQPQRMTSSSMLPSQSSSMPLHTSLAPGWTLAAPSLQSPDVLEV